MTRRSSRRVRTTRTRHGLLAGRPRQQRRLDVRTRRRRRRLALFLCVVVVGGLGGGAVFGAVALWRYVDRGYVFTPPARGPEVTIAIPSGASLGEIGEILEERQVVARAGPFVERAEADGYSRRFRPGTYTLHQYDSYEAIVGVLVAGNGPPSIKVTLPEGLNIRGMAKEVAERIGGFSAEEYRELTLTKPLPFKLAGHKSGTSLEGLLFPATYDFPPLTDARSLVELQLATFMKAFSNVDLTRAKAANLTAYDVVIIASMIEREVQVPKERRVVAAVIWNRLRKGMLLQIDATLEYALGNHKQALTTKDLKVDSPYNTYRYLGLPPTPICNPGLAALKAAANPADVDYLYYVVKNDGSGAHAFSNNYEQFLRDKAAAGL